MTWYHQSESALFQSTRVGTLAASLLGEAHETGILRCPNGCDFDDLQLGKEEESFMAVLGAPYQFVRCGNCLFNEKDPALGASEIALANDRDGAIANWNEAVRTELIRRVA